MRKGQGKRMNIFFGEENPCAERIVSAMEKSAKRCLDLEGIDETVCEMSVTFTDRDEIRRLNGKYRGTDKVTDVLSFPQYESVDDMNGEVIELGDVVICADKAEEQAVEFGHSFEREIVYLFTHSVLHLLGYDHMDEDDARRMRNREEEIMQYLNIAR